MRKIELQPTKENILDTFLSDSIGRNKDVCYFISLLETLDESTSIAINNNWGSGKTFFVKQIEMILGVYNEHYNTPFDEIESKKIKDLFGKTSDVLLVDEIKKLYLPIYYDAWKYDNEDDPVLSIVYEIITTLANKYDFQSSSLDYKEVLKGISSLVGLSGISHFIDSVKTNEDFRKIAQSRDLKRHVDDFLDKIPKGRADKIIILIDELDRCKPTYAIKLLERIKHYLNNDRIIFVFSTNLEELQHSVKSVYGEKFNAYRYLDRFFDLKIPLSEPDMNKYLLDINFGGNSSLFDIACNKVAMKYNFQLRDITKFSRYIKMTTYNVAHNSKLAGFSDEYIFCFCLHCLSPLVIGLFIYDINLYNKFINGENPAPLLDMFEDDFATCLTDKLLAYGEKFDEHSLVTKENRLIDLYDALFNESYQKTYSKVVGQMIIEKSAKKYLQGIISLLSKESQKIRNAEAESNG